MSAVVRWVGAPVTAHSAMQVQGVADGAAECCIMELPHIITFMRRLL